MNFKSLKKQRATHGGSLKNPQKHKRPLGFRTRNHFVLRSSKAKGAWSFRRHKFEIAQILKKFARKHHIGLISYANVGNHIHLQLELSDRRNYRRFIRAICSAIATRVTGFSRWNNSPEGFRFWDARPFSRVLSSWREVQILDRYIVKNIWQALGAGPQEAKDLARIGWLAPSGAENNTS